MSDNLFQQWQNQQLQASPMPPNLPQDQKLLSSNQTSNNNILLKSFLNSSNPSEFIQNMVTNNPKMKNVMQLFQTSGMTPKDFFYQYAQQKGVNPDQFLSSLVN